MSLHFSLSLPPSKNRMNIRTRWGIAPSHARKRWNDQAKDAMYQQVPGVSQLGFRYMEELILAHKYLVIGIEVFFPDNRRRDAANLIDPLCDLIEDVVGVDDQWFLPQIWQVTRNDPSPRVDITIIPRGKHDDISDVKEAGDDRVQAH